MLENMGASWLSDMKDFDPINANDRLPAHLSAHLQSRDEKKRKKSVEFMYIDKSEHEDRCGYWHIVVLC